VRKSRVGRNPNRPEKDVVIPRRAVIKFKAGKELKAHLKDLDLNQI
jgi:nucleoid DNA-binding protein